MKHKLQKIKEESQQLCAEISHDLRTSKNNLGKTMTNKPPFANLDEFDNWFFSDEPLRL